MRHVLILTAAAMPVCMPAVAAPAQTAAVAHPSAGDPYAPFVAEASRRFDIPAPWIREVLCVESGGDRHAVSTKGAMGLMQLMPETWAELRARYGLGPDPFDAHDNILAGAAFLREMHDRYGSSGFLAAYNAGPGRYEEYRDHGRPLPAETRDYVARLLSLPGDDARAVPLLTAAHDSPSWTRAPIFAERFIDVRLVGGVRPGPQSSQDPGGIRVRRDVSAIVPQSAGLFVAISAAGRTP